jgi:hypothetical protein
MRNDTNEIGAIEMATEDPAVTELSELQLGLVGGGTGEVVIA